MLVSEGRLLMEAITEGDREKTQLSQADAVSHNLNSSPTAFLFHVESAVQAEGTWGFCVINNFYEPRRQGSLPRTHTQNSSFIHQAHTYVLTLTPSSGFYLKTQHFEKSNTVASEIKLLRKLYVTVNLRFIVLGSCSTTAVALGFLAPAQYWQQLMRFLFALWLLFNKKHALWLIGFAPSGLVASLWGSKESDLALGQINSMACWLLTAHYNQSHIRHSKAVSYYMKPDRNNEHALLNRSPITAQFIWH